eukprot:1790475-Alexandrium_andersonii.AAC.1
MCIRDSRPSPLSRGGGACAASHGRSSGAVARLAFRLMGHAARHPECRAQPKWHARQLRTKG